MLQDAVLKALHRLYNHCFESFDFDFNFPFLSFFAFELVLDFDLFLFNKRFLPFSRSRSDVLVGTLSGPSPCGSSVSWASEVALNEVCSCCAAASDGQSFVDTRE